jgi:tRNA threonylcarbamoyladenosine biosynthesis protein TsaB
MAQSLQLLALDTSTDRMSVAVGRWLAGEPRVWSFEGPGGASASSLLIPTILDLMAQAGLAFADLDAIVFGRGPGAFTGLRGACAVAQGLGFGARARDGGAPLPLLALDSLLALAEEARFRHAPQAAPWQVLAMLDARMDEIYAGHYRWDGLCWATLSEPALARPQDLRIDADQAMAGNVFDAYGARLPADCAVAHLHALPTAGAMLRLAPALLAAGHGVDPALALPSYIRDKVASTSSERAAAKAAATFTKP